MGDEIVAGSRLCPSCGYEGGEVNCPSCGYYMDIPQGGRISSVDEEEGANNPCFPSDPPCPHCGARAGVYSTLAGFACQACGEEIQ